ncbi:hypothetical protein CTA2_5829 [Colletotrichum tanaceti]|uniref:Uncharacterized protein n=1 Tax=Colletotrichum tanaceti TaxID=1306861 RepID=A0A4U6XLU0_9PEZI|nr:hypothetical protein CTA2_5829 [Colletotrichum tanaceti]TKW56613.1 hypothetical protein CTA1_3545 [Colletotrichum tanaceti]
MSSSTVSSSINTGLLTFGTPSKLLNMTANTNDPGVIRVTKDAVECSQLEHSNRSDDELTSK